MYNDASSYAWGNVLSTFLASHYWPDEALSSDITVKEAVALANALTSFADTIKNSRVDVYVDSSPLLHACNNQANGSHAFSDALKAIFEALMASNCSLRLFHVPSVLNIADRPSWPLSLTDSHLSNDCWRRLQERKNSKRKKEFSAFLSSAAVK